jgi:hypothetical protein
MVAASIHKFEVWEDSGFSIMARVIGNDAANVTQASMTSIAYSVFDLSQVGTASSSGTLAVATVIFDTLQTDARWTPDATGYNFRWDVPANICPTGNKDYRIEILFTPVTGAVFHGVWEPNVKALHRS